MERNEIFRIYGKNYKEMTKALLEAAKLSLRINKGDRVGIKPNLVAPVPAEFGATTHPEVVEGIIEYLKENGIEKITILEGSWVGDKTSDAYEYCGYRALCEKYDIPFIDAQKEKYHTVDCGGMDINICDAVDDIDFMINVPVIKGHGQTKITCALKNMKGLIPNTEKRLFHKNGLHKPVGHLALGLKQDFIVIDHICGDLELEDGGNPIETNCVMVSLDPVLVDSYVCRLLGYETSDVEYIGVAEALGVGSSDLEGAVIKTLDLDSKEIISQHKASVEDDFEKFRDQSDRLMDIKIAVEEVDSCSACYGALLPVLLRLKEEGKLEEIMKKLPNKIAIGQGYQGKKGSFGIGNCCRDFDLNVKGCPPSEEAIYQSLINLLG